MKKQLLYFTVLMMGVVSYAGDVVTFFNAIKKNNYNEVKNAFEKVRNKKETNNELITRIREYYREKSEKAKSGSEFYLKNSPIAQAKIASGERGEPSWDESLRALRDLGFGK